MNRRTFFLFAPLALRAQRDADGALKAIQEKRARGEALSARERQYEQLIAQRRGYAATKVTMPSVSEDACPLKTVMVKARDGHETPALIRIPPGKGPFPAIIYLHGGLNTVGMGALRRIAREPNQGRFLAAGWVTITPTYRERGSDPQAPGALLDCLAVVEHVRGMAQVDPRSVAVWGTSGGGSLALDIAGETDVAAIIVDEPASVLFTGIMTERGKLQQQMENPHQFYTPELEKRTREKIGRIRRPIFLVEGGVHEINRINNEILIPELKRAGKELTVKLYPGELHGFSRGNGSPEAAREFFEDARRFLAPLLPTRPVPLDASLLKYVPTTGRGAPEQ